MFAGRGTDWNDSEIAGAVELYFSMLDREIRGESYVKMERYRRFCQRFPGRNVKAIERKCQNIAACLFEFGSPLVTGLKPQGNYQHAMRHAVIERLAERTAMLEQHAAAPAVSATTASLDSIDAVPEFPARCRRADAGAGAAVEESASRPTIDFAAREQANRSLGSSPDSPRDASTACNGGRAIRAGPPSAAPTSPRRPPPILS